MSPIVLYPQITTDYGDGSTTLSLPGSGLAVPGGLECIFSYSELTLNDLSVIDKYRITSIDGLDDADVRDSREDNPADHGETTYESFSGGRTLAIKGKIEAYAIYKLREMQEALRTAFSDLSEEKPLYFFTGDVDTDHFIYCKKNTKLQWGEEQSSDTDVFRDFLVTVRASDPRFYRHAKVTVNLNNSTPTLSLVNNGNIFTEPDVKIYGPISNFSVENGTYGEVLDFDNSFTLSSSQSIVIKSKEKTVKDQSGNNKFAELSDTSDWLRLYNGTNEISLIGTGMDTNTRVEISYRDAWI